MFSPLTILSLLILGYVINMFTITVLYHRGLAHGAFQLHPRVVSFIGRYGVWLTGIDPLAWIAMHRLHHRHSDTSLDPHSPHRFGVLGVLKGQMQSYELALAKLKEGDPEYSDIVRDIPFTVNTMSLNGLWLLPYFVQAGACLAIGSVLFQSVWAGAAFYFGLMSHPIQGWMVNSLAHMYGTTNFENGDHSKNNRWVALLTFGEGYQNNHHANPKAANFAMRSGELDLGYALCKVAKAAGLLR